MMSFETAFYILLGLAIAVSFVFWILRDARPLRPSDFAGWQSALGLVGILLLIIGIPFFGVFLIGLFLILVFFKG